MQRRMLSVIAPLLGALIGACAGAKRAPVPTVASSEIASSCSAEVKDLNVKDWRTVRADGFTFCVPQSWMLDRQYERIVAPRRTTGFASFSWAAPDTLQRVIVEMPYRDFSKNILEQELANCLPLNRGTSKGLREIGGQNVCATYAGTGTAYGVTVTYPRPFVRVRAIGAQEAMTVAETIRPIASSPR